MVERGGAGTNMHFPFVDCTIPPEINRIKRRAMRRAPVKDAGSGLATLPGSTRVLLSRFREGINPYDNTVHVVRRNMDLGRVHRGKFSREGLLVLASEHFVGNESTDLELLNWW